MIFRLAHFARFVDMHRQTGRKPDVAGQREAQPAARAVAYPAFAQKAISSVEKFGGTKPRGLAPARALIPALASASILFRRDDAIGDLASLREFAREPSRRVRSSAPILAPDPVQQRILGRIVGRLPWAASD